MSSLDELKKDFESGDLSAENWSRWNEWLSEREEPEDEESCVSDTQNTQLQHAEPPEQLPELTVLEWLVVHGIEHPMIAATILLIAYDIIF